MIRVDRGPTPDGLESSRKAEVARVAALVRAGKRLVFGVAYKKHGATLWEAQHYKCCYCERRLERPFNDVEHFRPKARADRGPGLPDHGYWWLAWTWRNLLFACPVCNRKHKKNQFPLAPGSRILPARWNPPGPEDGLLIDPSVEDPLEHIQFLPVMQRKKRKWMPFARGGSPRGDWTIEVLRLDRPALLTQYEDHVDTVVRDRVKEIGDAIKAGDAHEVRRAWDHALKRLFAPRQEFKALSHDALDHYFPVAVRQRWGLRLRRP